MSRICSQRTVGTELVVLFAGRLERRSARGDPLERELRRDDGSWWNAPILPVVDFNADSKVDIEDLKVFIAEWEKENPPALVVTP